MALKDGLRLNSFFSEGLGQSDEKAFGLDKSDVEVEDIPLVNHSVQQAELTRMNY